MAISFHKNFQGLRAFEHSPVLCLLFVTLRKVENHEIRRSTKFFFFLLGKAVARDIDKVHHKIVIPVDIVLDVHGIVAYGMSFVTDLKVCAEDSIKESAFSLDTSNNIKRNDCKAFVADPKVMLVEGKRDVGFVFADQWKR